MIQVQKTDARRLRNAAVALVCAFLLVVMGAPWWTFYPDFILGLILQEL